jgi:hypothetical protein
MYKIVKTLSTFSCLLEEEIDFIIIILLNYSTGVEKQFWLIDE